MLNVDTDTIRRYGANPKNTLDTHVRHVCLTWIRLHYRSVRASWSKATNIYPNY